VERSEVADRQRHALKRRKQLSADKQEKATPTMIEQAELLCRDWTP
jgi:hypothetical protein